MKNCFKICLCMLLLVFLVTGCGCNKKKSDESKDENTNLNEPVIKYEEIKNLKFGTASFYISGDDTVITTSVINETKKDIKVDNFNILLKDSTGNIIKKINVELGIIKSGETKQINETVNEKLVQTATIDYEIK